MKILSGLSLLMGLLLWTASAQPTPTPPKVCVTNADGEPLMYVDVTDAEGKLLAETDLNGCFQMEDSMREMEVFLKYPGYEEKAVQISTKTATDIVMEAINIVPPNAPVTKPAEAMIASSGEHEISGKVIADDGEGIIAASVWIAGTSTGTITDFDGNFVLKSPMECADLMVTYVGFENLEAREICAGEAQVLTLVEGPPLEDLMIVGYGMEDRVETETSPSIGYFDEIITTASGVSPKMSASPPPPAAPAMSEIAKKRAVSFDAEYAAPLLAADTYEVPAEVAVKGGAEALPGAGQLTAGEINDFGKWDMWTDINQEDLGMYRSTWQQYADHRYTLQLTNKDGLAINNAAVELVDGQGNVRWKARTDAQGRAELWAHYFRDVEVAANDLMIRGEAAGKSFELKNVKPFREGINFHSLRTDCREEVMIDMAFVVDATGSMGDEIKYLQAEILDVVNRVQAELPDADLRLGSVFYRDEGEEYLTKTQALSPEHDKAIAFLQEQYAAGGGDYPEAVEAALEEALDGLEWRDEASTRLLFLVLDAPPHAAAENIKRLQVAVTKAAARGIQIVPVSCSGVDKSTEYLMRSMALATNGTYTFVTDHSGIGNSHIEPSTDAYEVEHLNDVLVRLTVSMSALASCDQPIAITTLDPLPNTAERGWNYYPNPSSGPLTISFAYPEGTFYLADTQGKILQRFAAQQDLRLDLQQYPAGTYWLRHESTSGRLTQGQVLLVRR